MQDRNYILDRIKTKQMSIEEFNFDKLSAPPLSAFLTPYDIADLRYIATSVKLSAKPDIKYKMIDDILKRRNLRKFCSGTNRIVYTHPEFNNIVFKIAYDNIGMGDNPAEFRNQWLLKPFVAKTFEISPCGTVAIQERVNPIKSREEFFYIAEDVYTLLTEWIIGKYLVADCGSRFFMNFGVRSGFGVVVLDYPYLYELDGNKLFCTAPNKNNPSGKCDGIIDYDDGFNFLYCTKCGVKYKVNELAKHIDSKLITLRKEGSKMKVRTSGGTGAVANNNKVNKKIDEVATRGSIKKIPTNSIITDVPDPVVKKEVVNKVEEPKVEEVKKDEVVAKEVKKEPAKSPISFGEKTENKLNDGRNYVYEIEQALITIKECYDKIQFEQVKDDIASKIMDTACDLVEDPRIIADKALRKLSNADVAEFNAIYINNVIDKLSKEEIYALLDNGDLKDFIKEYVDVFGGVEHIDEEDKWILHLDLVGPEAGLPIEETVTFKSMDIELDINTNDVDKSDIVEDAVVEESNKKSNSSTYYAADIVDINTVKSDEPHMDVMLIDDNQGGYLYDSEGSLIVVDRIQEKDVNEINVVSKNWLDNIVKELEDLKGEKITVEEPEGIMTEALEKANIEAENFNK